MAQKPKLGVFKFASCDGCQLSLLDCEDEILPIAELIEIANFAEATRQVLPGPYDVTLVEGSITTSEDAERIQQVRKDSKFLITIGACATAGGIQSLRNFADVDEYARVVYAKPEYLSTLKTSTPIADHVKVDYELRGCPINKEQLIEVINAFLNQRPPNISDKSVCYECKLAGNVCVMVSQGEACLGPITHSGCGALCPEYARACFGCYGPKERAQVASLAEYMKDKNYSNQEIRDLLRSYNAGAKAFKEVSEKYED